MFRASLPTTPFPQPDIVFLTKALLDSIVVSLIVRKRLIEVVESAINMAPRFGGSISSARVAAITSPVSLSVSSLPIFSGNSLTLANIGIHSVPSHLSSDAGDVVMWRTAPAEFLV